MRFATVNGVVLHHRVEGPPDAPAVVFSNSLGTDFRVWDPLLAHFGEGLRLIRYDKRGHGLSQATPPPYEIQDHVGDLAALLDHLGVESVVAVGLSVGGIIAQGLSGLRPEKVRGLVLCDTAHKIGPPEMWDDRIAVLRDGGIEAMADAVMTRWFSQTFHAERAEELLGWRNMLVRTPLDGYLGTAFALRDADMTAQAQAVRVPALCVGGSEDGSTPPAVVGELASLIPDARFEVIEGAGHLPCVEAPEALAGLIAGFLKEKGLA